MDTEKIVDMLNQKGYKEKGVTERLHRNTYRIVGDTISISVDNWTRFDIRKNDQYTGVDTFTASLTLNDIKYKETTVDAYRFYQVLNEVIDGKIYGLDIIRGLTGIFNLTHPYEFRFWNGAKRYEDAKDYNRRRYVTFSRNIEECKNRMRDVIKNSQVRIDSRYDILYTERWWLPKVTVDYGMAYELVENK